MLSHKACSCSPAACLAAVALSREKTVQRGRDCQQFVFLAKLFDHVSNRHVRAATMLRRVIERSHKSLFGMTKEPGRRCSCSMRRRDNRHFRNRAFDIEDEATR
jgi:hypothetical protein